MSLHQFDPAQVVASWVTPGGSIDILEGAISGEFMTFSRDNARWAREFDLYGNATRVKNNNRGGVISITHSASSPLNTVLSALTVADDMTDSVVGIIVIRDMSGPTIVEADGCFLEGVSDFGFGQERGARTWVWQCASLRPFVGGHNTVG
jgi:hypothetical protein